MGFGLSPVPKRVNPPKFLSMADVSSKLKSNDRFWVHLWPTLEGAGWTLEPGKRGRDNDYYFIPPNLDRATARCARRSLSIMNTPRVR